MMTKEEFEQLLEIDTETENIEFKESAININNGSDSICAYATGISNAGGGMLILGVTNKKPREVKNISKYKDINSLKKTIYDTLGRNDVIVEQFEYEGKRVLIFYCDARPRGQVLDCQGVYYIRIGESLEKMKPADIFRIMQEGQDVDFSADIAEGATIQDLDTNAIARLRQEYQRKFPNTDASIADLKFLRNILLINGATQITKAAIILLGTSEAIEKYTPNAEIVFEYRKSPKDIQFVERKSFKQGYFGCVDEIEQLIQKHNYPVQYAVGAFRQSIPQFDQDVIREGLNNAVIHRDYTRSGSVFINQNEEGIVFESPGGFIDGITPDNVIDRREWRNRRLAESAEKGGLVERSGQGADIIFSNTIQQGKGFPTYTRSTDYNVILDIPGVVQDKEFFRFFQSLSSDIKRQLDVHDYIRLEKIRQGVVMELSSEDEHRFISLGLIEKTGKRKGRKYILSHGMYRAQNDAGEYTRLKGLAREKSKQLIISHIERNGKGTIAEFMQVFPELTRDSISRMLKDLKDENIITSVGENRRNAYWILQNKKIQKH